MKSSIKVNLPHCPFLQAKSEPKGILEFVD